MSAVSRLGPLKMAESFCNQGLVVIYKLAITRHDDTVLYYYGRTVNPKKRIGKHISELGLGIHKNPKMQSAYNKHGNIEWTVAAVCEYSRAVVTEQAFVHVCLADADCMNLAIVKSDGRVRASDETRSRMKAASTKRGLRMRGRRLTAEHRMKISEGGRGRLLTDEHKAKLRNRRHTEQTKEKLRQVRLGMKLPEWWCKKLSDAKKGKPATEGSVRALRDAVAKQQRPCVLVSPDGEPMRFDSITHAASYLSLPASVVNDYMHGRRKWPRCAEKSKIAGWTGYIERAD